jgi:prevent-host-death family protein
MSDALPLTEARARLGSLVRRVSRARERITITDRGRPVAVLVDPDELADLEEALALARYRVRHAAAPAGAALIPHGEVRARLGLDTV